MARSQSLKNPVDYLKTRVIQGGHSGEHGTYIIGPNVVIDPNQNSHLDTYDDARDFFRTLIDKDELFAQMVAILATEEIARAYYHVYEYFGVQGVSFHIVKDANKLHLLVFLPEVEVEEFEADVELLSHITLTLAKVARCEVGSLRVTIGVATLSWEKMEQENLLYTFERESN